MGRDKATLELPNGLTMLESARESLRALCDSVVTVGNRIRCDLKDANVGVGPLRGLLAALEHATSLGLESVLFRPVDVPLVRSNDVRELSEAQPEARVLWARSGDHEAP
ncbi:MAG: NTP transferase domain-containing protein, partial [Planctomycetes bacterium]|nr:NTP transferase domain-containing protein [Planctomycetota bacterium]